MTHDRTSSRSRWFALLLLSSACWCGCGEEAFERPPADAGIDVPFDAGADGGAFDAGPLGTLGVERVDPASGPFYGGDTVVVRGSAFPITVTVRFGDEAVPSADILRIDPNRIQVVTPEGAPGTVDVTVETLDGEATAEGVYTYERFGIEPAAGPPTGGTPVVIRSATDAFDEGLAVRFGGSDCANLEVVASDEARCETPSHALGTVDVVVDPGGAPTTLEDAFTYEDPFKSFGGLGGGPIAGSLTVKAKFGTDPLPNALVQVPGTDHRGRTGDDGTVVFTGEDLVGRQTVIVSHECFHHTGYVGFDAAYVTAQMRLYLLGCLGGGGGSSGVFPMPKGDVEGELVFYDGLEFLEPTFEWAGVPEPKAGERRVAYVVPVGPRDNLNGDGASAGVLTTMTVTVLDEEDARGDDGYRFRFEELAGAIGVIAVAGIESGGSFTPHVVGLGNPVTVLPGATAGPVVVRMTAQVIEGRDVGADVPASPPPMVWASHLGEAEVSGLGRLLVRSQYVVPGLVAGAPLFSHLTAAGGDTKHLDEVAGSSDATVGIPLQAEGGSFGEATHEILTVLLPSPPTSGPADDWPFDWYRQPHTRTALRVAVGAHAVTAEQFLAIPEFTIPSTPEEVFPHDRTLRWSLENGGPEPSLLRVEIGPPDSALGRSGPEALWYLFAHPEATEVMIPDLSGEPDIFPLGTGVRQVTIQASTVPGLTFDEIDTRAMDSLSIIRSSFNRTLVVVED